MVQIRIKKKLKGIVINAEFEFSSLRNVLFGPSGAGKSSILKMIAGFYDPDHGRMVVGNRIIFDKSGGVSVAVNRRRIGYLPQEYTLFPHMTIRDNMLYGVRVRRMTLDRVKFDGLVKKTRLDGYLKAYPSEISGGQKQRAALVRTLLVNPDILLLDEPFSALDKPIREELRELVMDIVDEFKIPTIFVSHDLEEAFIFAESLALIKDGVILENDDKNKVFQRPNSVEAAILLNFKNIWRINKRKEGRVNVGGIWLEINGNFEGEYCCIRPENVMILRDDTDNKDKENRIEGVITSMFHRGSYVFLKLERNKFFVFINIPPHVAYKMNLRKGKRITISLKRESLILCRGLTS